MCVCVRTCASSVQRVISLCALLVFDSFSCRLLLLPLLVLVLLRFPRVCWVALVHTWALAHFNLQSHYPLPSLLHYHFFVFFALSLLLLLTLHLPLNLTFLVLSLLYLSSVLLRSSSHSLLLSVAFSFSSLSLSLA